MPVLKSVRLPSSRKLTQVISISVRTCLVVTKLLSGFRLVASV